MQITHALDVLILGVLFAGGIWTVMTRSLIRSAIGLALTSAILTIVMFRLNSWLAGVFELSVCAGLISVVFISTISLTQPLTQPELEKYSRDRMSRFAFLPLVVIVLGAALLLIKVKFDVPLPLPQIETDARKVLWENRGLDVLGQLLIIMSGIFGVVVLFKEMRKR